MQLILSATLGAGVLMFLVLLSKQKKSKEDYFFLFWTLAVLLQIGFYEISIFQFPLKGILAIAAFALPLLTAPLLYLYIKFLIHKRLSSRETLLHLSIYPCFVVLFAGTIRATKTGIITAKGYLIGVPESPSWLHYFAIPLAISGFAYCVANLWVLKEHRERIVHFFSYEEKINLKWVKYMVYSYFLLFVISSFLIFGATQFQLFPIDFAFTWVGFTLGLILIAFGFYGFRQTDIFSNLSASKVSLSAKEDIFKKNEAVYAKSGLTLAKIEALAPQLTQYMQEKKPYLNENLTLTTLAQECAWSQAHLSQIINTYFKVNFYDFINQYRIEEAKSMLLSPHHDRLSFLGIAFDCGFKSKSSFNRYFKKYTGLSPTEFKKKHTK
ncbi:helix-turn-helix domain-containing protein [Spongiimicrobium salis]|uniref:helix-turn-helix domain-containing protein n=1 Tax=Spongiimicrobium salis TaxID=1667022 RepID=UPI00374CC026